MTKRLFIVGASLLQLPAVVKAKEMGLTVAVADRDSTAMAIPFADRYFNVSTVDPDGIYRAAKEFGADGIMTIATDMPMRAIAYTCERLGLLGISQSTALKATDKGIMMQTFEEYDLAHPWYKVFKSADDAVIHAETLNYPCICKPIDSSGSRGVTLVTAPSELEAAAHYSSSYSSGGGLIVEEYLVGSELSVEIAVWQGNATVLALTDKSTTGAPHFVETGHSQPSALPDNSANQVKKLALDAVKAVGIENGAAHVEIMLTPIRPKLIELGARMGGDCIASHLVPLSTGIDMVRAMINISLGQQPDLTPTLSRGAVIRYIPPIDGTIKEISGTDEARSIDGVCEIRLMKHMGDHIPDIRNSGDRLGFVITSAETREQAINICRDAVSKIKITHF